MSAKADVPATDEATGRPVGWPLDITVSYHGVHRTPRLRAGKADVLEFMMLPKAKAELWKQVPTFLEVGYLPEWYSYGDGGVGETLKKKWTWLGENLGYNFASAWNKTMFREWVAPHHHLAYPLCFGRYGRRGTLGYSPGMLSQLWVNKELVLQCERDGIFNISPVVMLSSSTPKQLKALFGNAAWKKITSQSLSRNKLLCYKFGMADGRMDVGMLDIPTTALREISSYQRIPAPVIKELLAAKKERKLNTYTSSVISRMTYEVGDAERMAAQLDEPFNLGWSYARIRREHQRLQMNVTAKQYGVEPFSVVCGPGSADFDGYSIILLDTPQAIAEEGTAQGHCVASYIPDASRGNCSIYSLRDADGNRLTTVQVYKKGSGAVYLGQHYGRFNRQPTAEESEVVKKWLLK